MLNTKCLIGITGGIGSGKSYVCQHIRKMGFPVYDCDSNAKRLMTENELLRGRITAVVGDDAYVEGKLNKAVIAAYLFKSAGHAAKINELVHPIVLDDFVSWAQREESDIVFVESAILYEAHLDTVCDTVILVDTPYETRIARVTSRDGCTREQALMRMQRQTPADQLRPRADFIIENGNSDDVLHDITEIITQIKNNH